MFVAPAKRRDEGLWQVAELCRPPETSEVFDERTLTGIVEIEDGQISARANEKVSGMAITMDGAAGQHQKGGPQSIEQRVCGRRTPRARGRVRDQVEKGREFTAQQADVVGLPARSIPKWRQAMNARDPSTGDAAECRRRLLAQLASLDPRKQHCIAHAFECGDTEAKVTVSAGNRCRDGKPAIGEMAQEGDLVVDIGCRMPVRPIDPQGAAFLPGAYQIDVVHTPHPQGDVNLVSECVSVRQLGGEGVRRQDGVMGREERAVHEDQRRTALAPAVRFFRMTPRNSLSDAIALADWRRQVWAIYDAARARTDDRAEAWRSWVAARDRLFRQHAQSPLKPGDRGEGLRFFPYQSALRFATELEPLVGRSAEIIDLGDDGHLSLQAIARTRGLAPALGADLTLYALGGYGGGLFLPFRDATNGYATYGGGRYLLDTIKGADLGTEDSRLVLDFNFAYHPSCAHDERWVCPLAPEENTLPLAIVAGERLTS